MAIKNRYDFIMLFDVENGNPNGDPDAGNSPRIDSETGYGIITDVCLKRKIRNYVELIKDGEPGFQILIKQDKSLNSKFTDAYKESGLEVDKKEKSEKDEKDEIIALSNSKKGYILPCNVFELEKNVKDILSIGNQTGEGWFLTAEMIEYIENGIDNIVCVQPFACLPNHVVGKGVIKTIREKYPNSNISPIDYDPGASEANQTNRLKLLLAVAKDNLNSKNLK